MQGRSHLTMGDISSVDVIIRLMLSEMVQPKVITLSGAYYVTHFSNKVPVGAYLRFLVRNISSLLRSYRLNHVDSLSLCLSFSLSISLSFSGSLALGLSVCLSLYLIHTHTHTLKHSQLHTNPLSFSLSFLKSARKKENFFAILGDKSKVFI